MDYDTGKMFELINAKLDAVLQHLANVEKAKASSEKKKEEE